MKPGRPKTNREASPMRQRRHLVAFLLLASVIAVICYRPRMSPTDDEQDGMKYPGLTSIGRSAPPSITQPPDQRVLLEAAGVLVTWTITDPENSTGTYIVAHDDFDPRENIASLPSMMRSWVNNTPFNVPVDTAQAGAHNYTIIFTDMLQAQLIAAAIAGTPISWGTDTAWIIVETPPTIQASNLLKIHEGETGRVLAFSIIDPDSPTGRMNVTMNSSIVLPTNTQWNDSQVVSIPLNASSSGFQHFTFVVSDGNYTVNRNATVWISLDFPPEIQDLLNRTVSPDIVMMTGAFKIVDMENVTGNYTILREGQVFNATYASATWTNDTAIYLNISLNAMGRIDFQVIAEDLSSNEMRQDFYVYVNIPPTVVTPPDSFNYYMEDGHDISWTIFDADDAVGTRVLEIITPLGTSFQLANSTWQSGVPFSTRTGTTYEGGWNYTLIFSDGHSIRQVTTIVTTRPARILNETGITQVLVGFIAAGVIGVGCILAKMKKKN